MPPKTRDSEAARDTISHSYLSVHSYGGSATSSSSARGICCYS